MHVIMNKLNEDSTYVSYKIETDIIDGYLINENGRRRSSFKTVFAFCKFNKLTEEFLLDKEKTDPYFLKENSREVRHAMVRLMHRTRENLLFEDIIEIATG